MLSPYGTKRSLTGLHCVQWMFNFNLSSRSVFTFFAWGGIGDGLRLQTIERLKRKELRRMGESLENIALYFVDQLDRG